MAAQQIKVLRIGVIRGGKIAEERILQPRQPVTLGTSPKNSIAVPDAALPATLTLFTWGGDRYQLQFPAGAEGRVQGPGGEADLAALVAQKRARPAAAGTFSVAVNDDQRGKLVLGDVTVLWQFVTPPPESPRPVLPREAKKNRFRSMDRLFSTVLLCSMLGHAALYAVLASAKVTEDLTLEDIPDRYARVLIPDRQPPVPQAEEKKPEVATEAKVEEKKPEKKPAASETPEQAAASKAARQAAAVKAVQSKGILKVLGALGPGTGQGAVADVFGNGGGAGDVATALAGAGGVAVATDPGAGGGRKGGGQGQAASIGSLATSGGGGNAVGYGAKSDVKVSGAVQAEDAEIDSAEIDQGKLGAFVRARMGLIKACYENALKRNPALKGKLTIRFTILETGGISDITVVVNSLGSQDVATCITGAMRTWRTQFRPEGPVTVEYPFVFSPAN
ncbi:MAG: AgmX/PglI C-terminal domain-containing protein [Anaeromyxobacter sp.]